MHVPTYVFLHDIAGEKVSFTVASKKDLHPFAKYRSFAICGIRVNVFSSKYLVFFFFLILMWVFFYIRNFYQKSMYCKYKLCFKICEDYVNKVFNVHAYNQHYSMLSRTEIMHLLRTYFYYIVYKI